jgi:D-alanine-D-alanine ligase
MEVNPLAGLNPVHSDLPILCGMLGISYTRLIEEIVRSAEKRINSSTSPERSLPHAHRRCA